MTDWQRIAFANTTFNVESGHRFADRFVELELGEARKVWARFHGGGLNKQFRSVCRGAALLQGECAAGVTM
jgi:hypothetical protein